MKHKGKWQNVIWYEAISSSITIFEDTVACLFRAQLSSVAKKQLVCNHPIWPLYPFSSYYFFSPSLF